MGDPEALHVFADRLRLLELLLETESSLIALVLGVPFLPICKRHGSQERKDDLS